jgi:hypothetical protein
MVWPSKASILSLVFFLRGNLVRQEYAGRWFSDDDPLGKAARALIDDKTLYRAMEFFLAGAEGHGVTATHRLEMETAL